MGNLLCKFRFPHRPLRRLRRSRPLPGDVWPLHPPSRDAVPPPGRDHPAAPSLALGPGRRLFHRNPRPLPASLYVQPKRRYPIPQASGGTPLGIPPLVNWSHSPKKPVLSARNSMMFGHSRAKRIPPLGRRFTLPRSLSEKVEEAVEPVPSRHLPLLCPFGVEEKVQEDPRKKMEDLVETKGQSGGNRVPHHVGDIPLKSSPLETGGLLTSSQRSPAPLDLRPNPPEDRLRENTQKSLMHCHPVGRAVTSPRGPAGNVPDTDTAALSDPPPRCPVLQETSTKEVSGESHQPVGDTSYLSRKEIQANEPPGISSRSSFSPVAASSRPCKRKTSTSHSRPPPPPQWWGQGELPPLPRFPCGATDKNLDTLKNTKCQRSKTLGDKREIKGDCSDAQSATSLCLLASETANSLLLASHTLQVPIPTDDLGDQSAKPPTASVPPSLIANLVQETAQMVSKSSPAVPAGVVPHLSSNLICGIPVKKEGPLQPVTAVTCLISDITTLANTSTPSLQPPSCIAESPVPLCVHSPPPILPAPLPNPSTQSPVSVVQPIISKTAASTIAANASTSTSRLTSGPGVINMDTTPFSKAVFFRSPQEPGMGRPSFPQGRCSLKQRGPAESPVFTSPPGDPKTALLASVAVSRSLSLVDSGVTSTPVGKPSATCNSACNSEAMDTPSPSQASIFCSSPESRDNHFPLNMVLSGSANTPPRGSTVVAHDSIHLPEKSSIGQTSVSNHSDPGITSQPSTGHHNGQQPDNSHLLGTPVASTQAMGPTALVAQPPRDNAVKAGLAGSASITTLTIQPASSDKPGILPIGVSTTTGFGVATRMPSTGDDGSPLADSTSGRRVFSGPAAPVGSGVYIPGPAHSQASGAFHLGAGLNGVPRTISAPTLGQTTRNRCGDGMAAAVGGTNTVPVFGQNASSTLNPGTWGPPIQNPGSGAVGQGCTVPTGGDSPVPTTHKCPGGSSRQGKLPSCRGDATVEKRTKSRDQAASPLNLSSRGPAIKTPGDGVVGEGRPVPSHGISSIAVSLKGTQTQSGQRKLVPRDRATRTDKKRGSGHVPACLNLIIRGRSVQNPGDVVGEGHAVPAGTSSLVPVSPKGTQSPPARRKLAPRHRATGTEMKRGSGHVPACLLNLIMRGQAVHDPGDVVGEGHAVPTGTSSRVPVSPKGTQTPSARRKLAPRHRATSTDSKCGSGHVPASLNLSVRGRAVQNPGDGVVGEGHAVPAGGSSLVIVGQKCTRKPCTQELNASCGRATTKQKTRVSRGVRVYPLQSPSHLPGHTASAAVASGSTSSTLGTTCSSTILPHKCGPPAQHADGMHGGDNVIPTNVEPSSSSPQNDCGRPNANAASAIADADSITSMMAGLYVSTTKKDTGSPLTPNTGGALGNSSTPATTRYTYGPSATQSTSAPHKHSAGGALGDSTRKC